MAAMPSGRNYAGLVFGMELYPPLRCPDFERRFSEGDPVTELFRCLVVVRSSRSRSRKTSRGKIDFVAKTFQPTQKSDVHNKAQRQSTTVLPALGYPPYKPRMMRFCLFAKSSKRLNHNEDTPRCTGDHSRSNTWAHKDTRFQITRVVLHIYLKNRRTMPGGHMAKAEQQGPRAMIEIVGPM